MSARFDTSQIPPSPDLSFELALWNAGIRCIAGLDEAGRGSWAGPVFAAAVVFSNSEHTHEKLNGVRDSKQMTAVRRAFFAPLIKQFSLCWGIGSATNTEIDDLGILPATRLAMARALGELECNPEHLLIDALFLPDIPNPQTALIKGDQRSLSIAAASILAKTARDEWMTRAHDDYPVYRFDRHKGYGTKTHLDALQGNGICSLHRRSFKPIKK
jgi:ribonuclease HII